MTSPAADSFDVEIIASPNVRAGLEHARLHRQFKRNRRVYRCHLSEWPQESQQCDKLRSAHLHVVIVDSARGMPDHFVRNLLKEASDPNKSPIKRLLAFGWLPLNDHNGNARPAIKTQPRLRPLFDTFEPEYIRLPASVRQIKTEIASALSREVQSESAPVRIAGITRYLLDRIAGLWSAFYHGGQSDAVNHGLGTFRALLSDVPDETYQRRNAANVVTRAVEYLSEGYGSTTLRDRLLIWLDASGESVSKDSVVSTLDSCAKLLKDWPSHIQGSVRAHALGNIARLQKDAQAIIVALKSPSSANPRDVVECIGRLLAAISEARQRMRPFRMSKTSSTVPGTLTGPDARVLLVENDCWHWLPVLKWLLEHGGIDAIHISPDGKKLCGYLGNRDPKSGGNPPRCCMECEATSPPNPAGEPFQEWLNRYDVVLMDVFLPQQMPEGEFPGLGIAETIKNRDRHLPVLVWTSSLDPIPAAHARLHDGYLFKKTLNIHELHANILRLATHRRAYRDFTLLHPVFNENIQTPILRQAAQRVAEFCMDYLDAFHALDVSYFRYFNDHGTKHSLRILDNMAKLISTKLPWPLGEQPRAESQSAHERLVEYDLFLLYCAAFAHDIGMFPKPDDRPSRSTGAQTPEICFTYGESEERRRNHAFESFHIIRNWSEQWWSGYEDDQGDASWKERIKKAHPGWSAALATVCRLDGLDVDLHALAASNPNMRVELAAILHKGDAEAFATTEGLIRNGSSIRLGDVWERLAFCAAILRLADVLDCDRRRVPPPFIRKDPRVPPKQLREYLKHQLVPWVQIGLDCVTIMIYGSPAATARSAVELAYQKYWSGQLSHVELRAKVDEHLEEHGNPLSTQLAEQVNELSAWRRICDQCADWGLAIIADVWLSVSEVARTWDWRIGQYAVAQGRPEVLSESLRVEQGDLYAQEDLPQMTGDQLTDTDKELIGQIVRDTSRMHVECLKAGYSGCRVYLITPTLKTGPHLVPKVVKIGKYEELETELYRYRAYAAPHLGPQAILGPMELYACRGRGALVGTFAPSREEPLPQSMHDLYKITDIGTLRGWIDHLFRDLLRVRQNFVETNADHPWQDRHVAIGDWRDDLAERLARSLFVSRLDFKESGIAERVIEELGPLLVLSDAETRRAFKSAEEWWQKRATGKRGTDISDNLWPAWRDLTCVRTALGKSPFLTAGSSKLAIIHGDLNWRNVLVTPTGPGRADRLVLIDYANTGPGMRFADFAKFESVLKFEVAPPREHPDVERWIAQERIALENVRLVPPPLGRADKRYDCWRNIRLRAKDLLCGNEEEELRLSYLAALLHFSVAVLAYYPLKVDNPTLSREMALRCAVLYMEALFRSKLTSAE